MKTWWNVEYKNNVTVTLTLGFKVVTSTLNFKVMTLTLDVNV